MNGRTFRGLMPGQMMVAPTGRFQVVVRDNHTFIDALTYKLHGPDQRRLNIGLDHATGLLYQVTGLNPTTVEPIPELDDAVVENPPWPSARKGDITLEEFSKSFFEDQDYHAAMLGPDDER